MNKVISVLLTMTILSGIALMSNTTSATKSVSNASVTVPEACTMTGSGMNSHTATITPGTFSASSGSDYENGIGKTTFTVVCNDYNGFAIYAIGYTGNSYDDTNHTKLVGSNTNVAIDTAVYNSGDTTSSWSMKVNKVTDSTISYLPANMSIQNSFDSWHTVPDTYTKVAQYKASTGSSTTDTTLGAKIDTTYAAFIAPNQPGDTYVGQVKYTLVNPYNANKPGPIEETTPSGQICYYANTYSYVGTMGCQTLSSSDTFITLLASNYSSTGYGFAGWSDKYDYATNPEAHFYGPQEEFHFTEGQYTGANPGLSLYAVWIKSAGNLQDSTKVSQLCGTGSGSLVAAPANGTANLTSVSALTDQRDNQTYAIAKLADGKCWMIENLRLESENTRTTEKRALAQGYGSSATYGNFGGLADAEFDNFADSIAANSLYYMGTQSGTASINIGTTDLPYYRMPRYNNSNTQSRAINPSSNGFNYNMTGGMYSYGNYYTWHAIIADLTYNGTNNSSSANTSLCPTGWHLPTGGGITDTVNVAENPSTWRDFYNLGYAIMGTTANDYYPPMTQNSNGHNAFRAFRNFPNNFLLSGEASSSSIYRRGSEMNYWTSTVTSGENSYIMEVNDYYGDFKPGTGATFKYSGLTVRCIVSS